jgi:hypothetical protein
VAIAEELTAGFVRTVYQAGAGAGHGSPSRAVVIKLKRFTEVALTELLNLG